jgi:branched-subunit amino acid transport protein
VREHGRNPNPDELGKLTKVGEVDTGTVYKQSVSIDDEAGSPIVLRRIELRLKQSTEDGETVIRLLSNVPMAQLSALELAHLYRRRWKIEMMFQRLEAVLQSEIPTLGQPRAALFSFEVAILAYNVLALIARAVTVQHELDNTRIEISLYYPAHCCPKRLNRSRTCVGKYGVSTGSGSILRMVALSAVQDSIN